MTRLRMVTEQDGVQHVSSMIVTADEAAGMLNIEERLHEAAGWEVTRYGSMLRCRRQTGQVRWVWVRNRTALEDTL